MDLIISSLALDGVTTLSSVARTRGDLDSSRSGLDTERRVHCICVLENEPQPGIIKKHIHELIGKEDELDELTKEQMSLNTPDNSWDLYTPRQDNEDVIPKNVGHFIERHNMLFKKYSTIFSRTLKDTPAKLPPLKLEVDDEKWQHNRNRLPPRGQSVEKQEYINNKIMEMQEQKVIRTSNATEWSQLVVVPKPQGKGWRICQDFKILNTITKGMGYPIPLIKNILHRIAYRKPKYFAKMDLTSGYHQIPLAEESKKYTAFRTLFGLYEWLRLPMGLKGAGHYFQWALATFVLIGCIGMICELYVDDIATYGSSEEDYFSNLEQIFLKFQLANITVNPDKCEFGKEEMEFVGHTIKNDGTHTHNRDRIEKVLVIEKPTTSNKLKSFIGVAEYFHDYIQNMATKLKPLRDLIENPYHKRQKIVWTPESEIAFEQIKEDINNCPSLYFLDDEGGIYLLTDASEYGIGAYLYQLIDAKERPVMFMSKSLSRVEIG